MALGVVINPFTVLFSYLVVLCISSPPPFSLLYLQIIRSGKEGTFPDLVRFAEAKLRELDPGSQFLIKEKGKTVLRDLPEVEQEKLRNDMEVYNLYVPHTF